MTNPVALVTGASRGIGRAIALTLASEGCIVVGTATSVAGAEAISKALGESSTKGKGMKLDVTELESIKNVHQAITDEFGAPTILINNAGITKDNLTMRMKDDEWEETLDANLSSIFRLSRACLRGMIKARFGRIVNISSVVAATGNPGQANYAAAKAGMIGFTKSLAREVATRNITVNTVSPGFIDTDMTRALQDNQQKAIFESIPMNRLGEAGDVAYAVAFLCSAKASYITGETLHVNGGLFMP